MAPKITKTVVIPKFDMHTYTSTLTLKELNKVIETFGVLKDLHPRLPSADLTMNRLPGDIIVVQAGALSLLYMSGLATDYRHPELSQILRDSEGKGNNNEKNGTVVSKGDPIPDDERPPKRTTDPFPPGSVIPDKNSLQNNVKKPEKKIAEASHSYHSKPKYIDDEEADANRFIPGWRLGNDLQIDSFEKELSIFSSKYFDIGRTLKESYEGMSKNFQLLENVHSRCTKRDRELAGQRGSGTKSKQLIDVEHRVHALQKEKEDLVARLAQSEMNRQSIVKDFILTAISMPQTSVEYQKSLAVPISLSYIASWLGDLGLGQKEEEIAKILLNINNLNIEGSKKIADSHQLPLSELMKIMSDVPIAPVDDQASSSVPVDHIELVNPNSANADVLLDLAEQV
ncbi:hypothetical protein Tco_0345360 [Tanacetum coccineum]